MAPQVRCTIDGCGTNCDSLKSLLGHIRIFHAYSKNWVTYCPVYPCQSSFSTAEGLRKHVEWRHRKEFQFDCRHNKAVATDLSNQPLEPAQESDDDEVGVAVPVRTSETLYNNFMDKMASSALRLRLHFDHNFDIPNSTALKLFHESISFALGMQRELSEVLTLRLQELEVKDASLDLFVKSPELQSVCRTTKGNVDSMLLSLHYVEPREIDLFSYTGTEPDGPPAVRPKMHYISILETLKSYLAHEDVLQCVLRETTHDDSENLHDFRSGSVFCEHPLFSVEPNALRIHLYSDELELCNPLGGNTKKHKICVVYFQVGNIGTTNLSSLQSIHLALIVRWSHVLKFKYSAIFKPLVEDLRLLASDGIQVSVRGGGMLKFKGAVAVICGDNLTQHYLGGFSLSFSSGKVCRFCMSDYKDLSSKSHEGLCVLRTPEMHAVHQANVEEDDSLSGVYGVNRGAIVQDIPFLKVPYSLSADLMHDILEKVAVLNVKVVLRGLNKTKVLKYSTALNYITKFKLGSCDRVNKPPDLSPNLMEKKYSVKGSASQKWSRFHFLSLALGPHVSADNKFWKLHLILNKICDIVLAVSVSKDMLLELKLLVKEHHDLWVKTVPGCYPPKLHYLIHYAELMMKLGPLRHTWCMRFEACHQYFKRLSQKCNNFIQVTKTLARRFQMKRCLTHSGENGLPHQVQISVSQKSLTLNELKFDVKTVIEEAWKEIEPIKYLSEVSAVKVNGLLAKRGCFNILHVVDGEPVFLLARRIFIINLKPFVYGSLALSKNFSKALHAFEVITSDKSEDLVCVPVVDLLPGQTLNAYSINGASYIKVQFTPLGNPRRD